MKRNEKLTTKRAGEAKKARASKIQCLSLSPLISNAEKGEKSCPAPMYFSLTLPRSLIGPVSGYTISFIPMFMKECKYIYIIPSISSIVCMHA